jgi:hypothetical protein
LYGDRPVELSFAETQVDTSTSTARYLLGELGRTYERMWTTPGIVNGSGQIRADKSGLDITVTPDDGVDADEFLVAAKTRAARSTVRVTVTLSKHRRQGMPQSGG